MGAFSRFLRPKMKLFAVDSDAFWKLWLCQIYEEGFGRIFTIYVSENKAVRSEVQTHFGNSLPASFPEKVLGAIPRFVRPKRERFFVKFRHILETFAFQAL